MEAGREPWSKSHPIYRPFQEDAAGLVEERKMRS